MTEGWAIFFAFGSLLGIGAAVSVTIKWLLDRKNANKQLQIQQDTLTVSEFNAQTAAYKDLLDRANASLKEANLKLGESVKQIDEFKAEREEFRTKIADLEKAQEEKTKDLETANGNINKLRDVLQRYIKRVGIPMTADEQRIFDETVPPPLRPLKVGR